MAMKKTSGGDSPLRKGAKKSFWSLPIFGSTTAVDRDVFWKSDREFRFFPSGGFIGEGAASEVGQGGLTTRGRGLALGRAALWCGRPVAPLRLSFGVLEAPVNIWTSGYCFVQF
jgi:hypothetical protein